MPRKHEQAHAGWYHFGYTVTMTEDAYCQDPVPACFDEATRCGWCSPRSIAFDHATRRAASPPQATPELGPGVGMAH